MFHKEGYTIILVTLIILAIGVVVTGQYVSNITVQKTIQIVLLIFALLILQFFRNPTRHTVLNEQHIIAPADGEIVIVDEVEEPEYFKDRRRQISIFMTPLNVHVTRYPTSGVVKFYKYHPGKYLIASHPKSSTLNERTTIVVENKTTGPVLFRQIAGMVARRIVCYAKEGDTAVQGTDAGFIKFGSRIDVFLPLDMEVKVNVGDKVRGGEQILATVKP